jgi:imidazolonepropionase-like amidohydrolase
LIESLFHQAVPLRCSSWFLAVVVALGCTSPRQSDSTAESLALVGVNVVDVETGQVHTNQTVLIVERQINAVGSDGTVDLPPATKLVEAGGKFLIPGLWDTHVHLTPFGEAVLPLFLAYGVTAVRDAGSSDVIFRWREEVASGQRLGPRIWTSGRMLAEARGADPGPEWERIDSPEVARQVVTQRKTEGANFLKIQDSFMASALWSATAAEAATQRLTIMGHAPVDVPLAVALRLGLRSIEHTIGLPLALSGSEKRLRERVMRAQTDSARWTALYEADVEALETLDSSRLRALATLMRDRGVALSPNLTDSRAMATAPSGRWNQDPRLVMVPPAVRELWRGMATAATPANTRNLQQLYERIPAIVLALHRRGVTILAGTDAWAVYDFPGSDLHSELWHLVQAGLTPLEALRTATLAPARFLKVADSLGSIRPGKLADLVLLDGNPLEDIRNTERIAGVVANGRYLDLAELEFLKTGAARAASTSSEPTVRR